MYKLSHGGIQKVYGIQKVLEEKKKMIKMTVGPRERLVDITMEVTMER